MLCVEFKSNRIINNKKMEAIFKKVMCSDRMPNETGIYQTSQLGQWYSTSEKAWGYVEMDCKFISYENSGIEWWLEEIELPSGDTMQILADVTYPKNAFEDENKQRDYDLKRHGFKNGFNKAIALIKDQ